MTLHPERLKIACNMIYIGHQLSLCYYECNECKTGSLVNLTYLHCSSILYWYFNLATQLQGLSEEQNLLHYKATPRNLISIICIPTPNQNHYIRYAILRNCYVNEERDALPSIYLVETSFQLNNAYSINDYEYSQYCRSTQLLILNCHLHLLKGDNDVQQIP